MLVSSQMYLNHPVTREIVDIGDRIRRRVEATDIDIVDVEQQEAARLVGQPAQELRLVHGGLREPRIGARILQDQGAFQIVLHLADPSRHVG